MKIGFQIIMFILILNLVAGLMNSQYINVPGSEYASGLDEELTGSNSTNYIGTFNASDLMQDQQPGIIESLPYLGNVYAFFMAMWNAITMIIDGFPQMLTQLGSTFELGIQGQSVFDSIANVVRAIFGFVIFMWLVQLVTGRDMEG